jgi:hypothetical protein
MSLLFGVVGEERSPGFPDFYRVLDRTDGRVAIPALGLSGSGRPVVRDFGVGSVSVFPGLVDAFAAAATTMSTRTQWRRRFENAFGNCQCLRNRSDCSRLFYVVISISMHG